jgi:hypothetical protein
MLALVILGATVALGLPRLERYLLRKEIERQLDRELRRIGFRRINRGWQRLDVRSALRRECGR